MPSAHLLNDPSYSVLAWRTGLFFLSLEHFASSYLLISQLLITLAQLDLTYQMFALWKIHPQGSRWMRSVPPLPANAISFLRAVLCWVGPLAFYVCSVDLNLNLGTWF